jgi:hypothetical protein
MKTEGKYFPLPLVMNFSSPHRLLSNECSHQNAPKKSLPGSLLRSEDMMLLFQVTWDTDEFRQGTMETITRVTTF